MLPVCLPRDWGGARRREPWVLVPAWQQWSWSRSRHLLGPSPHVETDVMPVQRLDPFWAQNVLGQPLLFPFYQLVYLQLLRLLAWGFFCPLLGLGQEPGSQTGACLPSPAYPPGAALHHCPGVLRGFFFGRLCILPICSLCCSQANPSKMSRDHGNLFAFPLCLA